MRCVSSSGRAISTWSRIRRQGKRSCPGREEALDNGIGLPGRQGLCGLDQHRVRRWRCWYRPFTLAMLVYAFLVVIALAGHTAIHHARADRLTCNDIQHLYAALIAWPAADRDHRLD
jgi:hypothetical protein